MKNVKVKLLVNTAFKGPKKEGDVFNVPEDFAKRWVKNGIAELVEEQEEEQVEAPIQEEAIEEPEEEIDYKSMSAKDLYALCKEKGLDVEAKKSKDYYIEKLG